MKQDRLKIPFALLLAVILPALAIILGGCRAGDTDARAAGEPTLHSSTPKTDAAGSQQLASEMDQSEKDADLVTQLVPIETRSVDTNVLHRTPIRALTPLDSGPGLVVCEPRAIATAADLADFGTGCGDWLQLIAAGQPTLGQTPTWDSRPRAARELKTDNLALTLGQAIGLRAIVGATDVAVGTISGNASHCTLKYRVFLLPAARPAGPALTVSGSEADILRGLPQMARSIDSQLKAAPQGVPASVGIGPADMQFLGHRAWHQPGTDAAVPDPIDKLVAKTPLAGVLDLAGNGTQFETHAEATIKTILGQAPANPIVYAQIARTDYIDILPYHAQIDSLYRRYPNNYLFAASDAWLHREDRNAQAERIAVEQIIRDAPNSPDAWLTFAYTVSNEAEAVRNGRFFDLLSPKEQAYIGALYPEWEYATWKACSLDPHDGPAWQRLAVAACFNSDDQRADDAFWRAVRLDGTDPEVYFWGLQMYQQKWDPDPDKLKKVAKLAAATNFANVNDTVKVADDLQYAGFVEEEASLIGRYESAMQTRLARNPNDADAHWDMAACYLEQKQYREAISEYQKTTALLPNLPGPWYDLGQACDDAEMTDSAIDAYQHVVKLDPRHKTAHFNLGYDLKHEHKLSAAEPELKLAARLNPYYGDVYFGLGELYLMENKPNLAIPEYERCVELEPETDIAYTRLTYLYENLHKPDKTIPIAYQGLLIGIGNTIVMDNLEDAFLQKHAYRHCIQICKDVLAVHPNDAVTQENLAEALNGNGEKAKAIAQWRTVSTMSNDPRMTQVAKSFLAKYQ